ncbi:MAG: hypothetical protein ACOCUT_02305 [bacterium]
MVDFSKADVRKLKSRLSSLSHFHPEIKNVNSPKITVSKPNEVPHEVRKLEAVARVLEATRQVDIVELKKIKERIAKLKDL